MKLPNEITLTFDVNQIRSSETKWNAWNIRNMSQTKDLRYQLKYHPPLLWS